MGLTAFGVEIRVIRTRLHIRTIELAKGLDVSVSYMSAVETGNKPLTAKFGSEVLDYLGEHYDVDLAPLSKAIDVTIDEVKINLSGYNDSDKHLVAAFARNFSSWDEKKKANFYNKFIEANNNE